MTSAVKSHRNKLNRERVSRCRAKKKLKLVLSDEVPAYSSKRSLGSAVSRTTKCLPQSLRSKKAVVSRLAEKVGSTKSTIKPKHPIDDVTKENVVKFYSRDDISRQGPGKKDFVTIWSEDGKSKIQKRHLYYTINETRALFKLDHPDANIEKIEIC